ncbi:thioredoxin reductase [Campylobacter concisus]|uniref:thioredoxin reductase n=1 Tax=Campylobacter concisus TaxID=199 RepID=UPI0011E6606E|nr:thioredoxin reductase [Campylobacter concisus]
MKKIIFIIIALLVAGSLLIINKGNLMSKENLMDNTNTYTVIAPNGMEIPFDKKTNLMIPNNDNYNKPRTNREYLEIQSKYLLEARSILDSSPYKNYKPLYYNPKPNSLGQTDYLSFKPWLDISYKASSNKLSPWTKTEKAYYESLKDKRDRYIYLVKRSNLKCTMIDIPDDAIGRVDSNGKLTKPEYAEIYDEVNAHKGTLKSMLFSAEWGMCAGILGDPMGFSYGNEAGFKARDYQRIFLAAQLGVVKALEYLGDLFEYQTYNIGLNTNLQMAEEFRRLAKNPPLDEYGMMPYLDEIVGNYFVMDFNRGLALDTDGRVMRYFRKLVEDEGKLLDPRDLDANETTREEFMTKMKDVLKDEMLPFDVAEPDDQEYRQVVLNRDINLLEAKILALTPPEGYPNAPYYNTPEELTRLYEAGKLDKKLNPLTPVMYRDSFPEDLRQKILSYAKEHNIKD